MQRCVAECFVLFVLICIFRFNFLLSVLTSPKEEDDDECRTARLVVSFCTYSPVKSVPLCRYMSMSMTLCMYSLFLPGCSGCSAFFSSDLCLTCFLCFHLTDCPVLPCLRPCSCVV